MGQETDSLIKITMDETSPGTGKASVTNTEKSLEKFHKMEVYLPVLELMINNLYNQTDNKHAAQLQKITHLKELIINKKFTKLDALKKCESVLRNFWNNFGNRLGPMPERVFDDDSSIRKESSDKKKNYISKAMLQKYVKPGVRPVSHVDNALLRPVRRESIHSKPYTPCTYSEWKRSKQNADLPDDKRRYPNDRIHTRSPPRSSRSPPRRPRSPPRRPKSPPRHSRSPPKTSTASVKIDSDSKQDGCSSDDLNSPLNSLYGAVIAAKTGRGYGPQKFKIPKRPQEPLPNKQKTQVSSDEVPQSKVTDSEDASNKSVTESEAQECIGEKKLLEELVGEDGEETPILKKSRRKEDGLPDTESVVTELYTEERIQGDESDITRNIKPTKRGKAKKKQIKKLKKETTAVGAELNDEDALETTSESSDIHPTRKKFKKRNSLELLQEDVKDMFISDDVLTANGYRTCRLSKEILDEMRSEKVSKVEVDEINTCTEKLPQVKVKSKYKSKKVKKIETGDEGNVSSGETDSSCLTSKDFDSSQELGIKVKDKSKKKSVATKANKKTLTAKAKSPRKKKKLSLKNENNMDEEANLRAPMVVLRRTDISKCGQEWATKTNMSGRNVARRGRKRGTKKPKQKKTSLIKLKKPVGKKRRKHWQQGVIKAPNKIKRKNKLVDVIKKTKRTAKQKSDDVTYDPPLEDKDFKENHLVSRLKREMQNRRALNLQNSEDENDTAIDKNSNKFSCISDELPENVVSKVESTPLPSILGEDLDDSIPSQNSNKDFTAPLSHPSQDFTVPVTQPSQDVTLPLAHPSQDVMVLAAYPSQDVTVLVPHQSQDVTVPVAHTSQDITVPVAHTSQDIIAPIAYPIQDITVPLAHSNQDVSDPLTLSSPSEDIDVTHSAPVFRIRVKRLPGDMLSFAKDNLSTPLDINETSNENNEDTDVDVEGLTIDEEAFSPAQVSLDCSDSVFSEQDLQQEPDNGQSVEDNFLPILIESVTSLNPDASSSTFDNLESELTSPSKEIFDHSYARPTFSLADGEIVAVENTFLLKQSSTTRPSLLKLNPPVGVAVASTSKSACTVNKATLSEKAGGAGNQRRKLQHKSSQAPSYSKSQKMPEVYNIMLEPRKLRHLYKCMGQTCSYTTNVTKNYIAHCKEHEEMRKKPLRKQKGIDWRQCAYCCVNLKTVDELVDHIQSTHGHCLFQCTYCFFRAMSQSYVVLHQHYKLHSYCFYQCMYCVHGGDTKEDMHHHLCNFHPNQPSTVLVRLFQTKDQSSAKNQVEDLITIDLDQEVVFNGMLLMPTPSPIETDEDSEDENDMLNSPTELAHNSDSSATVFVDQSDSSDSPELSTRNNPVAGSVFKKQNINKAWKTGSANNKQLKKNTLVIPNNTPEVPFDYKNVDLAEISRTGLTGLDLYLCGNVGCTYAGPTAANLKDHIYICDFARDSRNLVCKHCRRGFKQTHTLVEHALIYSSGNTQFKSQVKQPMRIASFSNSSTSNVTKTSYGPNDVHQLPMNAIFPQPISCAVCQFSTKVRVNLVRHLELHSSSNLSVAAVPSDCPVNPKELMFDKMVNLAASSHLRGEHKSDNTLSQEDEAKIPKYIPEHMRYVCGVTNCKYMACDETMLRYHIRALHCDEMSYKCPHCEEHVLDKTKVAVSIERLSAHLKMHDSHLTEILILESPNTDIMSAVIAALTESIKDNVSLVATYGRVTVLIDAILNHGRSYTFYFSDRSQQGHFSAFSAEKQDFMLMSDVSTEDKCTMGSGTSAHMTNSCDYVYKFEETVDDTSVVLGNNQEYKWRGI
uniref:C2H2-type domain-containing protein n=1 Tax=Timema genevievae TaxID=629358 RepID=A0A7R9JNZ8_TIMGE|nr:unnamed protein product [Timema genevievae]